MELSVKLKDIGRDELQFPGNHGVQVLISAALNVPVNTDMKPPVGQSESIMKKLLHLVWNTILESTAMPEMNKRHDRKIKH